MFFFALLSIENDDDRSFVADVYDKYHNKLYRYALSKTNNHHASLEITQDTFIAFISNLDKVSRCEMKTIYAYLFTVQKNFIIKYYREKSKYERFTALQDLYSVPSDEDVESILTSNENYNSLVKTIHKLPVPTSDIILLHIVHGLSLKRISKIVNMPYDAVKKRFERGKAALVSSLKGDINNEK